MINRILIRVKVVQLLYSYMVSRSNFDIQATPAQTTRERRFAHEIYLDLFLLMLRLSGRRLEGADAKAPLSAVKKLSENKIITALASNDFLRGLQLQDPHRLDRYAPIEKYLLDRIERDDAVSKYLSKRAATTIADDGQLWIDIINNIILPDPELEKLMRGFEGFSLHGVKRAVDMVTNAIEQFSEQRMILRKAQSELQTSLTKAYELYLRMFAIILDLTAEKERRQEDAKTKYLVTADDLNPNTRLTDNALVQYLTQNEALMDLFKAYNIHPAQPGDALVNLLLDRLLESDLYREYTEAPVTDFASDVEFWRTAMKTIIFTAPELEEEMEQLSVYWNDDLYSMGTFFLKSLRQIAHSEGKPVEILPKYKDEDDERFGADLFMMAVEHEDEYRALVDRFINTASWDTKRIALMDHVILITAIAEIIGYPQIPLAVSINEYVEIANSYSTDSSGAFVNGILFSVANYLNAEGVINKH